MHTELCDRLGIEFPIFAFSHCRDVVAAVTKAGGFGVLGALAYPAAQLEYELKWIDAQVGDKPYGVDIVIPGKYEGMGEIDPVKLEQQLIAAIPQAHRAFVDKILERHGIPDLPAEEKGGSDLLGWTAATAAPQIDVALRHPKVKLIANALGTPPPDVIERVHDSGRLMAALCGATKHALAQKKAGVDILIAQGHEGGGHCGEIGSMVLWPEVVDAVAPIPVLAAGGIGTGRQIAAALAMGAQGVWTGSIWLTVQEAELSPAQRERTFARPARTRCDRDRSPASPRACCATIGRRRGNRPSAQAAPDADAIPRGSAGCGSRAPPRGEGERAGIQSGRANRRPHERDALGQGSRLSTRRGISRGGRAAGQIDLGTNGLRRRVKQNRGIARIAL